MEDRSGRATQDPRPIYRGGPCAQQVFYSTAGGTAETYFIRAQTVALTRWGPNCSPLNAGDRCYVTWTGGYRVPAGNAYLRFQGWIKGQKKPFKELEVGPLVGENAIQKLGFPVTIPNVHEVAFRLLLEDESKLPRATSDAYVYEVDCKAK